MTPALEVPHLEVLGHPDDDDVFDQTGRLAVLLGNLKAPLRVQADVEAAGEVAMAEPALVGIESRQRAPLVLELLPHLERVHVEALPVGNDHQLVSQACQPLPELRGDAETPFWV